MKQLQDIAISLILGGASPLGHAADKLTVLVTGANRGIGLEYARQFADKGYRVIGTARDPGKAEELAAVADRVEALDVSDAASVSALAMRLDGEAIDILVNNAGVFDRGDVSIDKVDFDEMEHTLANTLGPLRVIQALLPNLRQGQRKHRQHVLATGQHRRIDRHLVRLPDQQGRAEPGHQAPECGTGQGRIRLRRRASGLGAHRYGWVCGNLLAGGERVRPGRSDGKT